MDDLIEIGSLLFGVWALGYLFGLLIVHFKKLIDHI